MARRHQPEDSFWASYADLATGTMVIFLLMMVALAAAMRQQKDAQAEEVRELARRVQVILGTRRRLAEAIHEAVSEQARVDLVTAQMVVDQQEGKITFQKSSAELTPGARSYVQQLIPGYVCALWKQDCKERGFTGLSECPRLDPEHPNGVRRILITGHADLVGSSDNNRNLSAQRADTVVQYALMLLRDPGGQHLPDICRPYRAGLLQYAEERFMALGAGDVEHCRQQLRVAEDGIDRTPCEALSTEAPSQRRVTFELELTGSDMTGLVLNLLELQEATGLTASEAGADQSAHAELRGLRDTIAAGCWAEPGRYHDCSTYIKRCLDRPTDALEARPQWCEGFDTQMNVPGSPLAMQVCRGAGSGREGLCKGLQ